VESALELLFRKYFWTINLLFLAAAAFLLARTANVFTEGQLIAPPDFTGAQSGIAPRPTYAMPTRISPEAFARLTGIPLPKEEPVVEAKAAVPKDDMSSSPVHTGLHARLMGTTVSTNKYWSWAAIEDTQAHTNDTFMVDDRIQGAKILDIRDDCSEWTHLPDPKACVLIFNGGHREYIDDKEGNGPIAAIAPIQPMVAMTEPTPPPAGGGTGVKVIDENNYEVAKSEVDKTLGNLNDVAMQARIVPAFKDGVATGFKLFSIRPDSIYSKIGIQNGDVIRRLNGFEINSPDKALEAYAKLKEANQIKIEVERNGSVVTKTYNITR
jgi:general secretion pathway protein C